MLKQILSYIMITEQVTGEVRLSLCSVVSISLQRCFLKPRLHSEGKSHANEFIINIVVTDIIKLVPGSPNSGLRSCCARGLVSHITPLPSVAGPLSLANSAPQNFSLASVHVFPGRAFSSASCSVPRGPRDEVPMQIMRPEMFIPLHCNGVNSLCGFNTCLKLIFILR